MTPRPLARTRCAALSLAFALGLITLAGCDPRQMLYFLQPFDPTVAPTGPSLKDKRVVMITKASPGATNDFPLVDRELNREVATILREKVKRIDLVDQDKVWAWDKAHPSWTDPSELAEKFEADMIVLLEIGQFQVQSPSSPDMFEGKAIVSVQVTELAHPKDSKGHVLRDKPKEAKVVCNEESVTNFPSRGPIPSSADFTRNSFKSKFLHLVATKVSWYFVDHAPGDDIEDAKLGQDR
jgi:hypothetical protein